MHDDVSLRVTQCSCFYVIYLLIAKFDVSFRVAPLLTLSIDAVKSNKKVQYDL